ncbi:hypothetical protein M422DRAFT_266348 [Sphaerobolus stellatus SS14]|uniref:DUF6532 domain-containing protein n=1 Tax=Sphaerobolus stellatus (strain SS14) TaxID=990650 RepID=A0A0C9V2Z8_SPHS4|nr:hypothetical protein M422DRAFT_266348 [Sphaerobolus stellatus SS14]
MRLLAAEKAAVNFQSSAFRCCPALIVPPPSLDVPPPSTLAFPPPDRVNSLKRCWQCSGDFKSRTVTDQADLIELFNQRSAIEQDSSRNSNVAVVSGSTATPPANTADPIQPSTASISPPVTISSDPTSAFQTTSGSSQRDPTFRDGKITMASASPNSKRVLNEAVFEYKLRLLVEHSFPETAGLKSKFIQAAWREAHKTKPPPDGTTIKLTRDTENLLHSLGTAFRGGQGSKLIAAAASSYGIPSRITPIGENMVAGLLEYGNLTYKTVYFDANGNVRRATKNPDIILRQRPPFSHPFLQTVINTVIFNSQNRPALGARFPDTFDPMPLETVAFACTMAHFSLKNLLVRKRREFSGDEYGHIFSDYLDMLREFKREEPQACEEVLVQLLDEANKNLGASADTFIQKKKPVGRGLDEAALSLERLMAQAAGPQASATAVNVNVNQNPAPFAPYGVPFHGSYGLGYPPGGPSVHYMGLPQGQNLSQHFTPNAPNPPQNAPK